MDSRAYDNIFTRANAGQRNFVEVRMNHAEILILSENQAGAIATRRLGGCSGIVVLGRTAAIMIHVAPLPPRDLRNNPRPATATQGLSESEQHFMDLLGRAENLYVNNRSHFPDETSGWGFYLADAEIVTDDLRTIASQRFGALGLRGQHTYYQPYRNADRRDEVRVGVQINGLGTTTFYMERRQVESIRFPDPLPDPYASQRQIQPGQMNYLTISARDPRLVQMLFGRAVAPDLTRMNGTYDVLSVAQDGRMAWRRYNVQSRTWQ